MRYFCEHHEGKQYAIIDRDDGTSAFVECPSKFAAMTLRDTARNMDAWGFDANGNPDATLPPHMLPPPDPPAPETVEDLAEKVAASPDVRLAVAASGPAIEDALAAGIADALAAAELHPSTDPEAIDPPPAT